MVKDEYKDPNMQAKVNEADMAEMMESIKEYLRSCHGVMRAPLEHVITKITTVQVYGDYPEYATPDDEMIARMLHLPPDKNKLHNEQNTSSH